MNKKLIIVSGPTATGKTDLSVELANLAISEKNLTPVIINFDSLCFFKEVEIGTAKPTIEERGHIQHELFDICSISEEFNASKFVNLAESKINQMLEEGKLVILTGGSAFYLRALIKGMYESIEIPEYLKDSTMNKYESEGINFIVEYLEKCDPKSLEILHENDHYRLIRAFYHHKLTGTKFSDEKNKMDQKNPYDLSADNKNDWDFFHIYLNIPKEEHYPIIEKRTQAMISKGLIDEVKNLLGQGFSGQEKPMQSIGYKEVIEYLQNNDNRENEQDLSELIERIFISTRQLAKSQRTFFKKITPKNEYNPLNDLTEIKQDFLKFIE